MTEQGHKLERKFWIYYAPTWLIPGNRNLTTRAITSVPSSCSLCLLLGERATHRLMLSVRALSTLPIFTGWSDILVVLVRVINLTANATDTSRFLSIATNTVIVKYCQCCLSICDWPYWANQSNTRRCCVCFECWRFVSVLCWRCVVRETNCLLHVLLVKNESLMRFEDVLYHVVVYPFRM